MRKIVLPNGVETTWFHCCWFDRDCRKDGPVSLGACVVRVGSWQHTFQSRRHRRMVKELGIIIPSYITRVRARGVSAAMNGVIPIPIWRAVAA